MRLWDVNKEKPQKNVIKPKSQQGRRLAPTTCAYSRDGRWVAAACQDGSIQIWDHRKPFFVSRGMLQYEAFTLCFRCFVLYFALLALLQCKLEEIHDICCSRIHTFINIK